MIVGIIAGLALGPTAPSGLRGDIVSGNSLTGLVAPLVLGGLTVAFVGMGVVGGAIRGWRWRWLRLGLIGAGALTYLLACWIA